MFILPDGTAVPVAQTIVVAPATSAASPPVPTPHKRRNGSMARPQQDTQSPNAPVTRLDAPSTAHLLGDWGGLRHRLEDIGLTPNLAYVSHTVSNVRGGTTDKTLTAGQFTAGVTADLPTLLGLPGTFQATIVRRFGTSFNAESGLNTLVTPQSIQGRGEVWRVSQLWYRAKVSGGILGGVDVKLGRMYFNEDFNQARCDFISGYFCLGNNTRAASTVWPTSPVSQWAVRVQEEVARNLTLKVGVYQYNPKNLDMTRNFYVGFKGATGVVLPAELVYTPKVNGLTGTYTLGMLFSNADQNDPVLNARGEIRSLHGGSALVRHAEWGGYFNVRQPLTKPRKDGAHGLTAFLNLSVLSTQSPNNENALSLGVNYSGPIAGRPRDELGLAFGTARLNHRITDAARYVDDNGLGDVAVRKREYVIEGYYAISIVHGFTLQPDIQFIFDPGGDRHRRNAIVPGFKTAIVL
ncbi:carbohydrate porin [Sphingomonas abietis]|uniref:Carbohydrate porin n=1 Tax=Sphingomonas abietis TaxID=3012344 RepID=A0ABY7NGP9_9SPHN|nr:carbohydrate porin [Sphingomonas abietis]WBO20725.1 carbohydrate porin [Sphingomonas abietis]